MIDIDKKIEDLYPCENCKDIQIKKFSPLKDSVDLTIIDKDYMRCQCGKRPLDIVMSHILKILMENSIVNLNASLRRNSPVPLSNFYYSNQNPQFIQKNTLILLHPDIDDITAVKLIDEVPEVVCVLKGSPQEIIGQIDKDADINHFEILAGDDTQINVMRTLLDEKLIIVKKQSIHHIEVAVTVEDKLLKLHNYLNKNNIKKGIAIDGMCGLGALGIYLLKYGFEKVIFNDINEEMIDQLKYNLKVNNIDENNYEILNNAFEDLQFCNLDLCIIDAFPNSNLDDICKHAEKISNNVFLI